MLQILTVFVVGKDICPQFVDEILGLAQLVVTAHPIKDPIYVFTKKPCISFLIASWQYPAVYLQNLIQYPPNEYYIVLDVNFPHDQEGVC